MTRDEQIEHDMRVVRDLMATCVVYEGRVLFDEVCVWLCPDDENPYKEVR